MVMWPFWMCRWVTMIFHINIPYNISLFSCYSLRIPLFITTRTIPRPVFLFFLFSCPLSSSSSSILLSVSSSVLSSMPIKTPLLIAAASPPPSDRTCRSMKDSHLMAFFHWNICLQTTLILC